MRVRFWGVRGSVPWATADSIGHGCNTPCVEIRDDRSGAMLVLDAGSGSVGLGNALGQTPCRVPILLSHFHWDHTQGLPFFKPFFIAGCTPSIWAPMLNGVSLEWVERLFESPYFPVPFDQLPNRPTVTLVRPGAIDIGGFHVGVQPLRHPGGAFAYRIHGQSGDLVYATDHEFGDETIDRPRHFGWGHASWRQAADFACTCRAGRLWLFHHKPGRTDDQLAAIEAQARSVFPGSHAASEGVSFEI
jgi:phosphoribosyl 1,2-cyclic phosphodiesterase